MVEMNAVMGFDILIKNGIVCDPARNIKAALDVAVKDSKIACVGEGINSAGTHNVIDASGCLVLPGLIDFHLHCFDYSSELAVPPDTMCLPCGVTAAVDAGSSGVANCDAFFLDVAARSHTRLKQFINVCATGLITSRFHENVDALHYDSVKLRRLFEKYPHTILGLKIRCSKDIVGDTGLAFLDRTLEISEELDCPIAVHATNPPGENGCADILERMREGDIFCHVFHGKGDTIIQQGRVRSEVKQAKERGVFFDAANGANHFDLSVARAALAEGFLPDIISTDLTSKTMYSPNAVMSLPFVMSKYLNLGIDISDIVERTTIIPARLMGMEGQIGSLKPGALADIAIFKEVLKKTQFFDHKGEFFWGERLLKPQLTILDGKVVYRQIDF